MRRDDKPWPEMLEEMIRDRLKPSRPVEVINAGIPRYHLKHNLLRLPVQILPLKPDMVISYHGANGFEMVHSAVPLRKVELPPTYRIRPLKLLADIEYDLKMIWYRRHPNSRPIPRISLPEAMQTQYAQAYRELIRIAETNGIRLVLANYSMAVNGGSKRGVIEFYRGGFPMVDWWIKANEIHSMIVKQLAGEHREISLVDTHPNLDGEHEKFVDVMHFTHEGERQLAESMFDGIKAVLAEDLSRSEPNRSNNPAGQ
jgi:lysophospholipase L1-like esterase